MEFALNTENLLLLGAVLLVVVLLIKVAKAIFRIALLIIAGGLLFYFWQGGTVNELEDRGVEKLFKNMTIKEMKTMCRTEYDSLKCPCIIEPVYEDLTERLSRNALRQLDKDQALRNKELRQSLKNKRRFISKCLVKRNGQKLKKGVDRLIDLLEKEK